MKPKVKPRDLTTGDLVLFKIPKQDKVYHVGIYLKGHRFLNASTSKGVIISNLQSGYLRDNYWQSLRVLD